MTFTQPNDEELMQFEEEIAYFYGAKNPKSIAEYYLRAIKEFEKLGRDADKNMLLNAMFVPLKKAYAEVQRQTSLDFDLNKAAQLELNLILAQAHEESFERIYDIMAQLYTVVFGVKTDALHKAALLRTFLYKYKISLLKMAGILSEEDRALLLSISRTSKKELSKIS